MKIIVADDEKWVRTTIINLIPFEKLGMSLAAEATNGIEALELCKQHKPDILITDIRMPGLSGLEVIQELKTLVQGIKIIIISGYNDFSYAKTAMKYGVTDYILKPVDEVELEQVLQKMKDTIITESKLNEEHDYIKSQYKLALPVMHENFLSNIITPNFLTTDVIKGTLKKYGINFDLPQFTLFIFSPDTPITIETKAMDNFKRFVRWAMKRYSYSVTFTKAPNAVEIITIINHKNENISVEIWKAIKLCSKIFKKNNCNSLSTGVSLSTNQITRLPELYAQAQEAINERFWDKPDSLFYFHHGKVIDNKNLNFKEDLLSDILINLKLSNLQEINSIITDFYSLLSSGQNINPRRVREFSWTLIQSFISRLNMQMPFIDYYISVKGIHPYEKIQNTTFIEQLKEIIKEMILIISDYYHQINPDTSVNIIETAKKIIEENYYKDLSLEHISKIIHLNPTYFSELFKKELGMSFIDYKTCVRMDNAKKLLTSSDMNVYEISSKIGYADSKYFSKLFKKLTGMTPNEYKERNKTPPVA